MRREALYSSVAGMATINRWSYGTNVPNKGGMTILKRFMFGSPSSYTTLAATLLDPRYRHVLSLVQARPYIEMTALADLLEMVGKSKGTPTLEMLECFLGNNE